MGEKPTKPCLEQITDKMEELEVHKERSNFYLQLRSHLKIFLEETEEDLDEEALAMKAMGLPTSFTSSLVSDSSISSSICILR
jgi:hypothetical protein